MENKLSDLAFHRRAIRVAIERFCDVGPEQRADLLDQIEDMQRGLLVHRPEDRRIADPDSWVDTWQPPIMTRRPAHAVPPPPAETIPDTPLGVPPVFRIVPKASNAA
ncbi:MAG: hypothetical protein R3D33_10775 [Hyphomicrobiaceae bacterium]